MSKRIVLVTAVVLGLIAPVNAAYASEYFVGPCSEADVSVTVEAGGTTVTVCAKTPEVKQV